MFGFLRRSKPQPPAPTEAPVGGVAVADAPTAAPRRRAEADRERPPARPSWVVRQLTAVWNLLWSPQLTSAELIELARSMRYYLNTGMTLRDSMRALSELGTRRVRRVASDLRKELASGWSLVAALEKQKHRFPTLFLTFVAVGEETGKLPEVMKDLEEYYDFQSKQKRRLAGAAFKPLLQFLIAVLVIAGLIYILAELPQPPQKRVAGKTEDGKPTVRMVDAPFDVTGLGLIGGPGARLLIIYVVGGMLLLYVVYKLLRQLLGRWAIVERVILAIPFLGGAVRAYALARFSFALNMTLDSSMSIVKGIRLAFAATDNAAFAAAGAAAETTLRRGNTVATALKNARLFPSSYLSAAAVAEDTGHLPEVMAQQAEYYDEHAQTRMSALYTSLGYFVWVGVAGVIAFLIIRLFNVFYGGALGIAESQFKL